MASIKNLKKDLKNAIGEVIEGTLIHQIVNDAEHQDKANELIDESIREFDAMIEQINKKTVENRKQHLKEVKKEIEAKLEVLVEKLNAL